jgi:phenylpropionate dioxygenase-like ring-hydroxylating dioxygenase large terminal subunit
MTTALPIDQMIDLRRGAISREIFVSPEFYREELEKLFTRAWLFVGHESLIAKPGDFFVSRMGEESVILCRDTQGAVHVFLNSCRHRGMKLACEDFGSVENWRCPYHGFTYGSKGEFLGTLIGAPYERIAYPGGLDHDALHLIEARLGSYKGLLFATWDEDAPPLDEYLGNVRWYLDMLFGRAEMQVVGVPQKWVIPAGWKLPSENFCSDAYHTATAHSFLARLKMVDSVAFGRDGYHVDPGGGHGLGIGVHEDPESYYPPELQDEYESNLTPEQVGLLARVKNLHGNVFPNMSFLQPNFIVVGGRRVSGIMLRVWQPAGPNRLQVYSWHLVERNAPDWWKELGKRMYVQTFGTSGMFDQDDTENWEAQTRNATSSLVRRDEVWLHYEMGIDGEAIPDFPGPGDVYDGKFSEAAGRTFYRTWLDYLLEEPA